MSANPIWDTGTMVYWKHIISDAMNAPQETEDMILRVSSDDDGIIHIRMKGNLSEDHLPEVIAWADRVKDEMKRAYERNPRRVLTLIDVTGAFEADAKTMSVLHALMLHNKDYATRTAVFGANYFIKMIVEVAVRSALRTNMHIFMTRDEALRWLLDDGSEVPSLD